MDSENSPVSVNTLPSALGTCEKEYDNKTLNSGKQDFSFHYYEDHLTSVLYYDQDQSSLNGQSHDERCMEGVISEPNNLDMELSACILNESVTTERDCSDSLEHSNDSNESENHLSNSSAVQNQIETKTLELSEDSISQDTKRTRRYKRKRDSGECCPVCGVTVRLHDLDGHFSKEVENLSKIPRNLRKTRQEDKGISTTFVQVKSNRENRLAAKVARYGSKPKSEIECPICSLKLTGTHEEVNKHLLRCINKEENPDEFSEFLIVDDEEEYNYEEYEFADQTRVRACSFIPGGYRSALQGQSSNRRATEDDEDVDVDVDDTLTYGEPQYTELDVIHNTTDADEVEELQQLRKAVLLDPTAQPHVLESRKWSNDTGENENAEEMKSVNDENSVNSDEHIENQSIEMAEKPVNEQPNEDSSLKEKKKDLEEQNGSVKCLICLDPYTKPVVSTTCWHVHCEECWLMTMGVKKLCPQCNMIVFPSDLRRIYL